MARLISILGAWFILSHDRWFEYLFHFDNFTDYSIHIYIYINIMLLKTRWRCLYCHLSASLLNIYFFLFKNATKNLSMWISYLVTEADLDPDSDSGFYPDSNTRLRLNHQIWTTSLASCTESWGNFCCWFSTIKIKSIYQGRVQGCWVKDASSLPLQVGL